VPDFSGGFLSSPRALTPISSDSINELVSHRTSIIAILPVIFTQSERF
jgi:hypothetical protein